MRKKTVVLALFLGFAVTGGLCAHFTSKKKEPEPAVKLYNRGVELMAKGQFASAQAFFASALAKKEDFAEAHNNLGYVLRKQGKEHYDEALQHYNRAIELNPKLAQAYEYRGVL